MEEAVMRLVKRKYRCIYLLLAILGVSYFFLPLIFTVATDNFIHKVTFWGVSIIWVYTFLQIPLTWLLGWLYWHYAKKIDMQTERLLQEGEGQ